MTTSDVETSGANLVYTVTTPPAHGSLSGTAPNLTYSPSANYSGPDSLTFTVTDRGDPDGCGSPSPSCAGARSATATITIRVGSVQFDLSSLLNDDVEIDSTGQSGDSIDGSNYAYMTASRAVALGYAGMGLPDNGLIPADGNHAAIQLAAIEGHEGFNVNLMLAGNNYIVSVPNRPYTQVQLFAVSTEGTASMTFTLYYNDATSDVRSMSVPDWIGGAPGPDEFYFVTGLARESNTGGVQAENAKIFGLNLNPNPAKTLTAIQVSLPAGGQRFVLFAAAGRGESEVCRRAPPGNGSPAVSLPR